MMETDLHHLTTVANLCRLVCGHSTFIT